MRYVAVTTIRLMAVPGVAPKKDAAGVVTAPGVRPKYKTVKAGTLLELNPEQLADYGGDSAVVPLDDLRAVKFGYGPKVAAEIASPKPVKLGRDEVPNENEDALSDEKKAFDAKRNPDGGAPNSGGAKPSVDVEAFGSHAAITEYLNTNGIVQPDGWEGMKLAEKKLALTAILAERGEGVAEDLI